MSLDVSLKQTMPTTVFSSNVTHNMTDMADAAGIYKHLWRPEELGIKKAGELIEPLAAGLAKLKLNPDKFKAHNPSNDWGSYDSFVEFVEEYLSACIKYSDAEIEVSR